MVAINTAYAAPKNAADPKNRVGDFFYEDHASVGKNRWSSRLNTQEKYSYHYETASGRSNWPNRDPIEEAGGINLYVFVKNDGVDYWDFLGERRQNQNTGDYTLTAGSREAGRGNHSRRGGSGQRDECNEGDRMIVASNVVDHESNCGGSSDKTVSYSESVSGSVSIGNVSVSVSWSKQTTIHVKCGSASAIQIEAECNCERVRRNRGSGYYNKWVCGNESVIGVDDPSYCGN
jgi:hypothetical protein